MREDDIFFENRKEKKRARKIASNKDRSKFKKTDFEKRKVKLQQGLKQKYCEKTLLKGRVLSVMPEEIHVEHEKKIYSCTLKGVLKKEKGSEKNLIVPGDFVLFDPNTYAIFFVEERVSFLSKRSPIQNKKEQYIASNIDLVLITVSVVSPPLNLALIDKYIIATRKGNMEPVLVINKVDLLEQEPKEKELFEKTCEIYKNLNIDVIALSAKTSEALSSLKKKMENKSSVFAGESGVGKTSLINLVTGLNLPTKEVTEKTQRGTHTTTRAHLIPLSFGGFCIDTPGIQKFGVWNLQKEDLDCYFPEITQIAQKCHYPNCSHTHEPHCAVKEALMQNLLSPLRFSSYQNLSHELTKENQY